MTTLREQSGSLAKPASVNVMTLALSRPAGHYRAGTPDAITALAKQFIEIVQTARCLWVSAAAQGG